MKSFLIVFCLIAFSVHSFSQKDAPIRSGDLAKTADDFLDSGNYKNALSLFDQVDRNDSNYKRSLYGRALSCQGDSQLNKAIQYCQEALQLKDRMDLQPNIYNTYANLLDYIGETEKSLAVFDEGIHQYPAYSNFYYNKGITLFNKSRFTEAEKVFEEGLLINPYLYNAHFFLGLCAIHQGKMIPAYLSLMGYMLLNPGGKYQKRCVNILSSMANAKDEILEYKTKRTEEGDENFSLTEDIFLSKIALEKEYKLSVSLDDPIFRQMQVICEKLEYREDDPDFWMQFYVPFYKKVFTQNEFEPYIFWSFEDIQNKEIQDYNKKNKKLSEHFVAETADYFNLIRSTRTLPYNKRNGQPVQYLYTNSELKGRGKLSPDGKSLDSAWTLYYPAGNLMGAGSFHNGKKYGEWNYYFFSGKLKATEHYVADKQEGRQIYYSETGLKTYDEFYQNEQKDGLQTEYYINGNVIYITGYKSGKMDGDYKMFYPGGELKTTAHYVNGQLDGSFTGYYENGQASNTGSYQNGKLEGPYKEFHENGQLSAEGIYKNNLNEGVWKYYYDNGKLKSKTTYQTGKQEGLEEEYYEDGPMSDTYTFKNGKLNGDAASYDKDQKLYARFLFSDDALQSAQYFDKSGKQFSTSVIKNGRLDLSLYLADGTLSTKRSLNEKGQKIGTDTVFFSNGRISRTTEYVNGEKNGLNTEYYLSGRKKSEYLMKNDKQDGHMVNYHPNGNIQSEGWVIEGLAAGYWNYYDHAGQLTDREYFVDGEPHGYQTEYHLNGNIAYERKFYKGVMEEIRQFDTTGKLLVYDSFPQFTGKVRLFYPDGRKMQEYNYVKGNIDGLLTQYYPDGTISFLRYYKYGLLDSNTVEYDYPHVKMLEGQYKAGKKTGFWKHYARAGYVETTEIYSEGELNGPRLFYSSANHLSGEIPFRHDKRHGLAYYKDPDSSLLYTITYDDGKVKSYGYLDREGKTVEVIPVEPGQINMKSFFKNGKPSRECTFIDNQLNGPDKLYYSNGKLRLEDNSEFGMYEGRFSEYYPNGNPKKIYNSQNDNYQGRYMEYNEQGKLIQDSNYNNGIMHGESRYYSDDGKLIETRYYYNGILLSVKK